jgi:long-subunit acyl-CoA synthetase (AMP-forming)
MISGSAPLSNKTHRYMQMIMCAPLYEGYGQTENTAAAFITYPGQVELNNVGGVVVITFLYRHLSNLSLLIFHK